MTTLPGLPPMPENYTSDTTLIDLGWISGLHKAANNTLMGIYGDYDEFRLNREDILNFDDLNADAFVNDSVGPIIYLGVWAVAMIIFLIVGICWCGLNKCCCCCRSSFKGRKRDDYENDDPQLRPYSQRNSKSGSMSGSAIVLSIIMALLLIAFLIMILHTFASNTKTKDAIDRITPDLTNAINDVDLYITGTEAQIIHALTTSFATLKTGIATDLTECVNHPDPLIPTCLDLRQAVEPQVETTESTLTSSSSSLRNALNDVQTAMEDAKDKLDGEYQDALTDANNGLYWFLMLLNVLYCVVFVLVLIGTVLAAFARSSGLKTGGFLLIRGAIVFMFILGILAILEMLAMFVISGVASGIICPAIRDLETTIVPVTEDPSVTSFGNAGDSLKQGNGGYEVPDFGQILRDCKSNKPAYLAFNLESAFRINDLEDIKNTFDQIIAPIPPLPEGPYPSAVKIRDKVAVYIDNVVYTISNDVGQCQPAYRAINSTVNLFCETITAPVASFWFILQFIPITFVLMFLTALFFERLNL